MGTGSIGMITPTGVVTTFTGPTPNQSVFLPSAIATGPDGALWFTNANDTIGRITTSGVVTDYSASGIVEPNSITAGPDGAMWFTNSGTGTIGRITMAGVVTIFPGTGFDEPGSIVSGPDGALWYTTEGPINRITTTGTITQYGDTSGEPYALTNGPDGALWFLQEWNMIGRISVALPLTGTATTITQETENPVVDQPITVDVAVSSSAGASSYPTGSVTVSSGSDGSCNAVLSGSSGQSTGSCTLAGSAVGTLSLTASYAGDDGYGASSTPSPTEVSIGKASSTTELSWSATKAVYGKEKKLVFTATVLPQFGGIPTGTVVLKESKQRLCTVVLQGGTGTCAPASNTLLKPAVYSIVAAYGGDQNFIGSSHTSSLRIKKT